MQFHEARKVWASEFLWTPVSGWFGDQDGPDPALSDLKLAQNCKNSAKSPRHQMLTRPDAHAVTIHMHMECKGSKWSATATQAQNIHFLEPWRPGGLLCNFRPSTAILAIAWCPPQVALPVLAHRSGFLVCYFRQPKKLTGWPPVAAICDLAVLPEIQELENIRIIVGPEISLRHRKLKFPRSRGPLNWLCRAC